MQTKTPINTHRLRKVPRQFNWVDHRLVRERHIEKCTHIGAALYLFLVTVSDVNGVSYYSDASVMARLSMDPKTLVDARNNLIQADLLAYRKPLYQVLSLDMPTDLRTPLDRPLSLGDILKKAATGGR